MALSASLSPLKNGPLSSQAFAAIRGAIFAGKYLPGQPLRELQLCKELQVSQVIVREALLQLEHAGLVQKTPNIGTVVTELSEEEIHDRCEMRIPLEGIAAVKAAGRIGPAEITELERRLTVLAEAVERNDYYAASHADLEFHQYIWERSGSVILYRTLDQITAPLFAFVSIVRSRESQQLRSAVRSHRPIIRALKQGDPDGIRSVIRTHIEVSYAKFFKASASKS